MNLNIFIYDHKTQRNRFLNPVNLIKTKLCIIIQTVSNIFNSNPTRTQFPTNNNSNNNMKEILFLFFLFPSFFMLLDMKERGGKTPGERGAL